MSSFFTSDFSSDHKFKKDNFVDVMRRAIWYHLYNLRHVTNTHGGVLLLVKLQALKVALLRGCFSRLLNCTNGTKSRKASRFNQFHTTDLFLHKLWFSNFVRGYRKKSVKKMS